jgi:peptidyl-dipeptidase Dcp
MKKFFNYRLAAAALSILAASILMAANMQTTTSAAATGANPLTEKWQGSYGGVPPFDKVKVSDFKPALEEAMAENLREIDAIANNPAKPSFENTFVPLEGSGQMLTRVRTVFGVWESSMSSPEFEPVQAEMQPMLAAHDDKITQNKALFKRIEAVYNSPEKKKLTNEQQRLVQVYYESYVHAGAALSDERKARLSEINQQIAGLSAKFNQNLQGEESELYLQIDKEADLSGLPQSLKDAAAEAARSKGKTGWIVKKTL